MNCKSYSKIQRDIFNAKHKQIGETRDVYVQCIFPPAAHRFIVCAIRIYDLLSVFYIFWKMPRNVLPWLFTLKMYHTPKSDIIFESLLFATKTFHAVVSLIARWKTFEDWPLTKRVYTPLKRILLETHDHWKW